MGIIEQGSFQAYANIRLDEARSTINEYSLYSRKTTVFISHKHDELQELKGVLGFLQKWYDVKTYIDSRDPSMPHITTAETATNLKARMKVDGGYSWFKKTGTNCHGNSTVSYEMSKVFNIISENHFNSNPEQWHCEKCKTYDWLNGSYIAFVEEADFLADPQKYINNAYDKSENDASGYDLVKQR